MNEASCLAGCTVLFNERESAEAYSEATYSQKNDSTQPGTYKFQAEERGKRILTSDQCSASVDPLHRVREKEWGGSCGVL